MTVLIYDVPGREPEETPSQGTAGIHTYDHPERPTVGIVDGIRGKDRYYGGYYAREEAGRRGLKCEVWIHHYWTFRAGDTSYTETFARTTHHGGPGHFSSEHLTRAEVEAMIGQPYQGSGPPPTPLPWIGITEPSPARIHQMTEPIPIWGVDPPEVVFDWMLANSRSLVSRQLAEGMTPAEIRAQMDESVVSGVVETGWSDVYADMIAAVNRRVSREMLGG